MTPVRLGLLVLLGFAAATLLVRLEWRAQRASAGVCLATSERMTDAAVLRTARAYRDRLAAISDRSVPDGPCCRIVPDAALRAEERPRARDLRRGLQRAQADIFLLDAEGAPITRRIIVTTCGDVRTSFYE